MDTERRANSIEFVSLCWDDGIRCSSIRGTFFLTIVAGSSCGEPHHHRQQGWPRPYRSSELWRAGQIRWAACREYRLDEYEGATIHDRRIAASTGPEPLVIYYFTVTAYICKSIWYVSGHSFTTHIGGRYVILCMLVSNLVHHDMHFPSPSYYYVACAYRLLCYHIFVACDVVICMRIWNSAITCLQALAIALTPSVCIDGICPSEDSCSTLLLLTDVRLAHDLKHRPPDARSCRPYAHLHRRDSPIGRFERCPFATGRSFLYFTSQLEHGAIFLPSPPPIIVQCPPKVGNLASCCSPCTHIRKISFLDLVISLSFPPWPAAL